MDLCDFERTVEQAWFTPQIGTLMFQICAKIKVYRISLLKLRNQHKMNSRRAIKDIKEKMDILQQEGGIRDWKEWKHLQKSLEEEYKGEKAIVVKNL